MTKSNFLAGKILIPALLLTFSLSACDSSDSVDTSATSDTFDLSQSIDLIATDLDLSTGEVEILAASLNDHEGRSKEPGFLWEVAADIQANMSDEQKARLFERIASRPGPGPELHNGGPANRPFMGRPGFFTRMGSDFSDVLQLSDDQIDAIKLIRESFRADLKAIADGVKDGSADRADAREQMRAIADEMRSQLDSILTDDQRATLDTMKTERQAMREERAAVAKEAMIAVLGLSSGQVDALETLRASIDDERLEFRELIEGGATREEIKELAAAAHAANLAALSGFLDQTQYEIFVIHGAIASRMKRNKGPRNNGMPQG